MRQTIIAILFVCGFFAYSATNTFGQGYNFATIAVGEGLTDEAFAKCGALPSAAPTDFYNPAQTSYQKAGQSYIVKRDHYACMWTGANFQWKAEPGGSSYHRLSNGELSFEGYAAMRIRACHNRVLAIFYAEITVAVTVNPTPAPTPVVVVQPTPLPCQPGETHTEDIVENGAVVGKRTYNNCTEVSRITYTQTEYVNPCPTDIDFDGKISNSSRFLGGLPQAGIGAGISILLTKIQGGTLKDALYDGAKSAATQRVEQALNASEDGFNISIPSMKIQAYVKVGEEKALGQGMYVKWNNGHASVSRLVDGQTFRCDGDGLKKTSNLAIWTSNRRNETTKTNTPVKTQTNTPVGQGGLNGGNCIPGARNCPIVSSVPHLPSVQNPNPTSGNGIPVRPFTNGFVSNAAGVVQQNSSNTISQPKTGCDADPSAVCMNVLQADGTTIRMRVN